MECKPLDIIIRFDLPGDSTQAEFFAASEAIYNKYSISVKTYEQYNYISMHAIEAKAVINYQRKSIMQHVYRKGIIHKVYYLDVVVHPDGSLAFQRFH